MNCKPGDLAIVVSSKTGNIGRLCRVVAMATSHDAAAYGVQLRGPTWIVSERMRVRNALTGLEKFVPLAPDVALRPIRGQEGTDETLTWAGLPGKVEA